MQLLFSILRAIMVVVQVSLGFGRCALSTVLAQSLLRLSENPILQLQDLWKGRRRVVDLGTLNSLVSLTFQAGVWAGGGEVMAIFIADLLLDIIRADCRDNT